MTEAKKYNCCGSCPKCGSDDVDWIDDDNDGRELSNKWQCLSCNCLFFEVFKKDKKLRYDYSEIAYER